MKVVHLPTHMLLTCGRKLENVEEAHMYTENARLNPRTVSQQNLFVYRDNVAAEPTVQGVKLSMI